MSEEFNTYKKLLCFDYTNYKGITEFRMVTPISIRYGTSEYHKEPQWLLLAFDEDRNAEREFVMIDMQQMEPLAI